MSEQSVELIIEHSDAEGTVLHGTARGDGTAGIVKKRRVAVGPEPGRLVPAA